MKARSPEQVLRIDGRNVFMEVMLSGITMDKVLLNFMQYDITRQQGQRAVGQIGVYIPMYEALRVSRDIMSGKIPRLGAIAREKAKEGENRYPDAVYLALSGTPAKYHPEGKTIARKFTIAPGSNKPWVFTAMQGRGHETEQGLIVMDGRPEVTIRVAIDDDKLKEFALAIETVERIWEWNRFSSVMAEKMRNVLQKLESAIENAKAQAAARMQAAS